MVDQINPLVISQSKHLHSILIPILYYDVTQLPSLSYPRVMANRSDLTLQGGPNSHDTCKPRQSTRVNCSHHHPDVQVRSPTWRTPSEPEDDYNTRHRSMYRCK